MKTKPAPITRKTLAASLGVSERTITNWKREGAPVRDPEAMAKWLEARSKRVEGKAGLLDERRRLQCDVLKLQAERLRHDLDVQRRLYLPEREVCAAVEQAVTRARTDLLALPPQLAMPFGGIAPQIQAHATKVIREVLTRLAEEAGPKGRYPTPG